MTDEPFNPNAAIDGYRAVVNAMRAQRFPTQRRA